MTPTENLYYALGEMLYALAASDGKLQQKEKQNLHQILTKEFLPHHPPIDCAEIIFKMFEKDHTTVRDAVRSAKHQFELNSHYLSPQLKRHFIKIMQEVAHVHPPVTEDEQKLVNDFQAFLTELKGDAVFYDKE